MTQPSITFGDYAHTVIAQQTARMVKQEKEVLADQDPEHLHAMRVSTRRLRAALQVFGIAIKLPKAAGVKRLRELAQVLGQLRDLDVQIHHLTIDYRHRLDEVEQQPLDIALKVLKTQRHEAFAHVKVALHQSRYHNLKTALTLWLNQPNYTPLAQLPLAILIPDLLTPLLSKLLLHPGWLVSVHDLSTSNGIVLHDLRKICKQIRYQAEFFTSFYDQSFQNWVEEMKTLQDHLGQVQDIFVLQSLLESKGDPNSMAGLHQIMCQEQKDAMSDWETRRHQYLNPRFRLQLHQIILQPLQAPEKVSP